MLSWPAATGTSALRAPAPNVGVRLRMGKMVIYHIAHRCIFNDQEVTGKYSVDSLGSEGFIHCCGNESDLLEVANHLFRSSEDLVVVRIATNALEAPVRWETAPGDPNIKRLFPHIYGSINMEAVDGIYDLEIDGNGNFVGLREKQIK